MISDIEIVESFQSLDEGDESVVRKYVGEEEVESFAQISGDDNPLHMDEEYAEETMFGDRIVHGALLNGIVSAALAELPGTVVYISQESNFVNPVFLGETVTVRATVTEELETNQYVIETRLLREDGETAVVGESVVQVNE